LTIYPAHCCDLLMPARGPAIIGLVTLAQLIPG
jgi:hypothetical protein